MITNSVTLDGYSRHSIWGQAESLRQLYARRCRREAEEMTAHAQAAELLSARIAPRDSVLDAGCGSGYFFHSLNQRNMPVDYIGVDACATLLDVGRAIMPQFGLPSEQLIEGRLEDLDGAVDHVVCLNVLSNIDNYHRPFERMLAMARKSVIIRESLKTGAEYSYVRDHFLDQGVSLNVHVNHYDIDEISDFAVARGFSAQVVKDRRTGGLPEDVIGHPHYWTFLVADRVARVSS